MAALSYELLTDPAPLQVPEAGEEPNGSVYLVVSNPTPDEVIWYSIELRVPCGQREGDLTAHPKSINARIAQNNATRAGEDPTSVWDDGNGVLTVTPRPNSLFREAGSLVLVLDGFPVSDKPGLVLLQVTERAANCSRAQRNPVTLGLVKQLPKVPRNFRPQESLVAGGADVVLRWDGPANLEYRIQGPDGLSVPVPQRTGAGWEWAPKAGEEPKRDATYTLTATLPGRAQPGYFLTTTVHLRSPEFEAVTATAGVHTPWVRGTTTARGRITFTGQGAQIRDEADALGTLAAAGVEAVTVEARQVDAVELRAAEAAIGTVTAGSVRGHDDDAGRIEFPPGGIRVGHGSGGDLGIVTVETVSAAGINTGWVGDRAGAKGWLEFPQSGVEVRKDGGTDWGTVTAGEADLNDLVTRRAQVRERLTLQGGLTVDNVLETQDGPPRLIVHGGLEAEGDLNAWRTLTVAGDLSTKAMLRVQGESRFQGKVNANGHLSVRNGQEWIVHTNDGQVSVKGDLRVHGAFRADS
ncbi:hypothetical protein ACFWXO_45385 [Kitasatospora sp. NPDC059088]|uniref:hypothetical protein n=1 Tax=Kitasatospora sp. NPDC059088 TaxID=3346722 RepID=UPI0036C1843E